MKPLVQGPRHNAGKTTASPLERRTVSPYTATPAHARLVNCWRAGSPCTATPGDALPFTWRRGLCLFVPPHHKTPTLSVGDELCLETPSHRETVVPELCHFTPLHRETLAPSVGDQAQCFPYLHSCSQNRQGITRVAALMKF